VRFFGLDPAAVLTAVLEGTVDAGFVPAGAVEAMVASGEVGASDLHVVVGQQILNRIDSPFAYSTRLAAPGWTLSALSQVSKVCSTMP
jgi:hypothetical protein